MPQDGRLRQGEDVDAVADTEVAGHQQIQRARAGGVSKPPEKRVEVGQVRVAVEGGSDFRRGANGHMDEVREWRTIIVARADGSCLGNSACQFLTGISMAPARAFAVTGPAARAPPWVGHSARHLLLTGTGGVARGTPMCDPRQVIRRSDILRSESVHLRTFHFRSSNPLFAIAFLAVVLALLMFFLSAALAVAAGALVLGGVGYTVRRLLGGRTLRRGNEAGVHAHQLDASREVFPATTSRPLPLLDEGREAR